MKDGVCFMKLAHAVTTQKDIATGAYGVAVRDGSSWLSSTIHL